MVATAVLLAVGLDRDFQATIADDLPAALVNPTGGLESSAPVERALAGVRPARTAHGTGLRMLGPAPEFTGTQRWFNTPGGRPLTLRSLRGRVVLVDFWTYTCINCLRTLPYLRAWDARYRRAGLTIVGVHTPEFPFERDAGNVAGHRRQSPALRGRPGQPHGDLERVPERLLAGEVPHRRPRAAALRALRGGGLRRDRAGDPPAVGGGAAARRAPPPRPCGRSGRRRAT